MLHLATICWSDWGWQKRAKPATPSFPLARNDDWPWRLLVAHQPPVLILDEPTAGLDVESRTELHSMMQELREDNTSILMATHDMAEAEKMADRVAILLGGKIVVEGSPTDLTAAGDGFTKVSVRSERSLLQQNNVNFPAVQQKAVKEDYAIYFSTDPGPTVTAILDHLDSQTRHPHRSAGGTPFAGRTFPGDHQNRRTKMNAFATHFSFEFKTGLRNPTLMMMNYLFPLGFYALMGLVMTQINPIFKETMIPAMIIFTVMASCLLGLPNLLVESREQGYLPQLQDQWRACHIHSWLSPP